MSCITAEAMLLRTVSQHYCLTFSRRTHDVKSDLQKKNVQDVKKKQGISYLIDVSRSWYQVLN